MRKYLALRWHELYSLRNTEINFRKLGTFLIGKKEHVLNFSSFLINRFLLLALFAVSVSLFINRVGNEKYGVLTAIFVLFGYLSLVDLGVAYAVNYRFTRAIAKQKDLSVSLNIVRKAVPFYLTLGVLVSITVFLLSPVIARLFLKKIEYSILFKLMAISFFPLILDSVAIAIIQAYNKVYLLNLSRFLMDLFRVTGVIIAALKGGDLLIVMVFVVVSCYMKLLVDIYLVNKMIGTMEWMKPIFSINDIIFNTKMGASMFMIVVTCLLLNSLDKLYIVSFMSLEELSYYSVASDINGKAWFLIWAVSGSIYTTLIKKKNNRADTKKIFQLSLLAVFVIFILYYLPLLVFSKQILTLWISKGFAEKSYRLTQISSIISGLYMISAVLHCFLQSHNQTRTLLKGYLAFLLLLVISLFSLQIFSIQSLQTIVYIYVGLYSLLNGFFLNAVHSVLGQNSGK